MRRKRIAARRVKQELDAAEKSLQWLADNTTELERLRCINDLFWLRSNRL